MIPYGRHLIDQKDHEAVLDSLKSGALTQGEAVHNFSKKIGQYVGSKNVILMNSATSCLHVALLCTDVQRDDLVWTSPISFCASANVAMMCGCKIDFVDIDLGSFNISPAALEAKFESSLKNGLTLPKVLIYVHMAGNPGHAQEIYTICKKYDCVVIEDASHSFGASYEGKKVGSLSYADFAVFSFHPVKMITTGEGGALIVKDEATLEVAKRFTSHGISRGASNFHTSQDTDIWAYDQVSLGYNYRMSDINAALGCSQLDKIETFVNERNKTAQLYQKSLPSNIYSQKVKSADTSSYHIYVVRFDSREQRNLAVQNLKLEGVTTQLHYLPIYKLAYYQKLGFPANYLHNTEIYYDSALTLPLYVDIDEEIVFEVCKLVQQI